MTTRAGIPLARASVARSRALASGLPRRERKARLYGDALLQVVFTALGVYGWWSWRFGGARPLCRAR